MKKIFAFVAVICAAAAVSCTKDNGKGSESGYAGIKVYAYQQDGKNTNKIIFENTEKGISGQFDYQYGKTTFGATKEEAIVPATGKIKVQFKGSNSTTFDEVNLDFEVNVEVLAFEHPATAALALLSKTWTWDEDASENGPWGESGFRTEYEPWDSFVDDFNYYSSNAYDAEAAVPAIWGRGAKMTFSADGGFKFTRTDASGKVVETGTFTIDLSKPLYNIYNDDGADPWPLWSIGTITFDGVTLPLGDRIDNYATEETGPAYTYYIVELSEDALLLATYIGCSSIDDLLEEHPDGGDWDWDETWMWLLKPVE